MKKYTLILTLLTVCMLFVSGQTPTDSITMQKAFGGYRLYQGDQSLNMSQLVKIMEPNEQAYKEIKAAQSNITIASIFALAGGAMIGWPLGTAIGGGEPNWALAGIGAGLVIISIPIASKCNKQIKTAVDIYNRGLKTSSFWHKTEFRFVMTGNGFGFRLII
ncbi:MAG: hypothetical protein JXB19_11710 [Bacteroidales bacterium]|nr:hypothetical protein [Bacteroidales bacterium]